MESQMIPTILDGVTHFNPVEGGALNPKSTAILRRYSLPIIIHRNVVSPGQLIREHPKALEYLAGVAVHWYADMITPACVLSAVAESHPDKVILATEACEGSYPWQRHVEPGSWTRAVNYISDIIEDLNHYVVGWIDWNLCLNTEGGPNWVKNFVDSPIIVDATNKEFIKQPMYYALAHASKFVPRDSRRIRLTVHKRLFATSLKSIAFLTTRHTVVLIMYNKGGARSVTVTCGDLRASFDLEADSISTMEFSYDASDLGA